MIKIRLTSKISYSQLRVQYLRRIVKYINFDEKDIFPDSKNAKSGKTKKTAEELKKKFPELYNYLFRPGTDVVNCDNLKFLLIGPDSLPQSLGGNGKIETMRSCLEEIIEKCPMPKEKTAKKAVKKVCQAIFQYSKFTANKEDAYWLLRTLDVRVCPYCNRIYTVTLPSKEELEKDELFKATRATFDHFYCQDKFPYLALSLFNLVPSCYSCNLSKRDSERPLVYPYDEEFGKEVVFGLFPSKEGRKGSHSVEPLNYLHGESDNFCIEFITQGGSVLHGGISLKKRLAGIEDKKFRKRIEGTIEKFNLEQLYAEHKMEIRDILRNRFYFNKEYVRTAICPLIQQVRRETGKKDLEPDVLEKMAMDMLFFSKLKGEEWEKRPLSKLISDILEWVSV